MSANANVTIVLGPAGAGKRAAALDRYRHVVARGELAPQRRGLWLAPTQAAAAAVRDDLVRSPADALLDPGVMTFAQFAAAVVRDAGVPIRTISDLQRRRLLRTTIDEAAAAGTLEYFAPVADSAGFLTLAADWIADMQHRDVPAAVARRRAGRGSQRDRELATLYASYEGRLEASGLIDAKGLFRVAREAMARAPRLGEGLVLVVADGFTDFTRAQQEILQLLAKRAGTVLITLVGEATSARAELFAKTQAMARSLQRLGGAQVAGVQSPATAWPAIDHLQRNLFRSFHDVESPSPAVRDSLDRFHVVAASSEQAEIEEIARQVKRRLLAGVAPGEIVVSFRSTHGVADRVRQVFGDHGIPIYLDAAQRLSATPLVRSLLALMRLHAEDWPYRLLLRVVGDRALRNLDAKAQGGDARAAAELCVRHAQLPSGRRALAEQLALWSSGDEDAAPGTPRHAARRAAPALDQLAGWLGELPARGDLPAWIEAMDRLAEQAGLATSQPAETAAQWGRLLRGLHSAAQLDDLIGAPAADLDAAEFAQVLAATAAELPAPQTRDATGRVRVLSAESARHTRPRHLLIGGLSEDAFPAERRRLRTALSAVDAGEGASTTVDGGDEVDELAPSEMLLFYQLVTRPTETLALSYPALDAKAQPLPPSPLLVELERAFGDAALPRTVQSLTYAAHDATAPMSRSELRRAAVAAAQDRRRELLASLVRSPQSGAIGASIVDGVEMVASRARRQFSGFEGLCSSDAMRTSLAQKYGPEYLWSPSRLEAYAGCPFKFFGEYLLKLAPLPELALESDMARRGTLLHDTLARLYERVASEAGVTPPAPEEVAEQFSQTLDAVAGSRPGRGLDGALREIERRQIAAWAKMFAQQHDAYSRAWDHLDEPLVPKHFEVRFGGKRRRRDDEGEEPAAGLSTELPFELIVGDERLRFAGQIDRIDVGRVGDTVVFSVIDYKTSARAAVNDADMAAGKQIQLPLYALAVAELLLADEQAAGLSAGYWSVRGKGYNLAARSGGPLKLGEVANGAVRPVAKWLADRDALVARIGEIVAEIRSGNFPVYNDDPNCGTYCPYSTVCRIGHVRSLEKVWPPRPG
jgi:ATP-dependent helicase/DNAse subunit B